MTTDLRPPQQLRLPGQAAAPDGPNDLAGMYVMHHAFRRDLRAFAAAVASTPAHSRDRWRALHERWQEFSLFLHHHHSTEDAALWPLLLARVDAAGDALGRATLEAMEAEHEGIDPLLTACGEGFATLARRTDDDARAALEVRVVAARDQLQAHLAHEEHDALTLVQRHLTPAEWHHLDTVFGQAYSFPETLRAMPWALHELPAEARRRLLVGPTGRVFEAVWRLLLRPRFERRERFAFGS